MKLELRSHAFAPGYSRRSRHPPRYQGLVLGIAGAGNVDTALSTLFGPWSAAASGWHAAFGIAVVPVLATLALVELLAEDSLTRPAPKRFAEYAAVLKRADTGWFCFFYAITFGGFVGLVSFLSISFRDEYALTKIQGRSGRHALRGRRVAISPPGRLLVGSAWPLPGADLALSRRRGDDGGRVVPASGRPLHRAACDQHDSAWDGQWRHIPKSPPPPGVLGREFAGFAALSPAQIPSLDAKDSKKNRNSGRETQPNAMS
jgi:hypothetical protein